MGRERRPDLGHHPDERQRGDRPHDQRDSTDCNGGNDPNATVIVAVAEDNLAAVTADNYSGTLTLVVEPD